LASLGFIGGKRFAAAKVQAVGRALPRALRASACGHAIHERRPRPFRTGAKRKDIC
jgi:hypothetical protein